MSDNIPKPEVVLPVELQGKTPEEMYRILNEAHARDLEALRVAPPATPEPPKPAEPQFVPRPVVQPPPMMTSPQNMEEPNFLTDPNAYMQHQFEQRIQPLAMGIAESMRNTNRDVFRNKIGPELWTRYGQKIEEFVNALAPQVQMQLGAYDVAFNYIRGQDMDAIIEEETKKRVDKAVQDVYTTLEVAPPQPQQTTASTSLFQPITGVVTTPRPPAHFNPQVPKPKTKLTPEQEKARRMFDMTEEEYLQMAEMNNDEISIMRREAQNG